MSNDQSEEAVTALLLCDRCGKTVRHPLVVLLDRDTIPCDCGAPIDLTGVENRLLIEELAKLVRTPPAFAH